MLSGGIADKLRPLLKWLALIPFPVAALLAASLALAQTAPIEQRSTTSAERLGGRHTQPSIDLAALIGELASKAKQARMAHRVEIDTTGSEKGVQSYQFRQ